MVSPFNEDYVEYYIISSQLTACARWWWWICRLMPMFLISMRKNKEEFWMAKFYFRSGSAVGQGSRIKEVQLCVFWGFRIAWKKGSAIFCVFCGKNYGFLLLIITFKTEELFPLKTQKDTVLFSSQFEIRRIRRKLNAVFSPLTRSNNAAGFFRDFGKYPKRGIVFSLESA